MTKHHILHLIDGLNIGGAEILLRDLVYGLQMRGYRLSVGYSTPGPLASDLVARKVRLTRLPRLARIDPFLLLGMVRLMRQDPPHIVHTHLFKSDFHGRLAARLAGAPIVISTLHNSDLWARNRLLGTLYGATARFADRLIAVSEEVRQYQIAHTGVPADKIITIENGIDARHFSPEEALGQAIRSEFGIDNTAPLFGIIGRHKPQKDHATFLLAAAEILRLMPAARFLVVGDGPLRVELEAQASNLGIRPALVFTGIRTDIPAILAALDVLVFSSLWEGLPITLLEGMAAARPVVATAVDGIQGVALAEITALLVPPREPIKLAEACVRLGKDRRLAREMGLAGQMRVMARYSLEAMIDRTSHLYDELLQARNLGKLMQSGSTKPGEVS